MRVTDREFEPVRVSLRADDDELLNLVIFQHSGAVAEEGKVKIDGRGGAELKRVEDFQAALRTAFENKPPPARDLSLTDAGPAAAEIRAREIYQVADRRGLGAEKANPGADNQRTRAVNDHVKAVLQ